MGDSFEAFEFDDLDFVFFLTEPFSFEEPCVEEPFDPVGPR